MQTIVETSAYLNAALDAGVSADERQAIVDYLAANPAAGDLMQGCGGARKLRWRKRGTGESGGYRIITFYGGDDIPVFLLTLFAKGEKVSLSKAEQNGLATLTKRLRDHY